MEAYFKPSKEMLSLINPHMKKGEKCKVSNLIELNGKLYREVIIYKRSLTAFRDEPKGYLYIDLDNKIVLSKNVQRELAKLAYFYETFYSSEKGSGILAAFQNEDSLEGDKAVFNEAAKGFDYLHSQEVTNALRIKHVINIIPELREKSNIEINKLSKSASEALENNTPFNQEVLDSLYPVYERILELNFEKIKLIASVQDCCDEVKDAAEKIKKKFKVRFDQKIVVPLVRAADQVSYFRRIIRTYKSVLNFSNSQYLRFLEDINKQKVEQRFNMIIE
ncbi:hypothetical protein JK636_20775 [Clostridium sp. YIM B02515]|uniref:Uncharacterized protein n=1 Tax=Clostridium rhizosphaerae TaxID=2803861 RepID=A0ABS1TH90_9CLOT|nr:hypothetical protein [Clostridium rhizosphaerae]MBL4938152.1 hypothetical protein [Clostridium rhizosphaerae]